MKYTAEQHARSPWRILSVVSTGIASGAALVAIIFCYLTEAWPDPRAMFLIIAERYVLTFYLAGMACRGVGRWRGEPKI